MIERVEAGTRWRIGLSADTFSDGRVFDRERILASCARLHLGGERKVRPYKDRVRILFLAGFPLTTCPSCATRALGAIIHGSSFMPDQ
jgi:hypothetical protein